MGPSTTPRRFTGKEYEGDVKLYYYGARYYDPYIGRFTSRDPAQQGLNWYVYANNNPLKFVDPNGLQPERAHAGTVGQFIAAMNNSPSGVGEKTGTDALYTLMSFGERKGLEPQTTPYFK